MQSHSEPSRTLTAREVAAILGVAESTMYDHLKKEGHINGIEGIRIGRRWIFSRYRIEQLVGPLPSEPAFVKDGAGEDASKG